MLNLIKSNRMENLVRALCTVISDPPEHPVDAEFIGIQSRGMKQWLSQEIARHFGVCANVRFMFPRQMLDYIRAQAVPRPEPNAPEPEVLNRESMTWAVLDLLMAGDLDRAMENGLKPGRSESAPVGPGAYLKQDENGIRAMSLSRRIATVLDDYQVYRPEMLAEWARGETQPADAPHAVWQAQLWQKVMKNGACLTDRMRACIDALESDAVNPEAVLPRRISLFGISSMPPFFLELFHQLGQHMDLFLFLLTPTPHFFFDLLSPQQQERAALKEKPLADLHETGNPLLGALGQNSRQLQGILENFDYSDPLDDRLFEDPGDTDMLRVIQSDILNLVWRGKGRGAAPIAVDPGDTSLTLHACHSPMREAQVLKDQLLDAFNRHPDLQPHDVVVMVPDIERYAPFLEAVFSRSPKLPFTVSDRRRRSESLTISAFLSILDLDGSRLEKSLVMALLSCPVIADKYGLTREDQALVSDLFDAAGVLWGRNGAHRKAILGQSYEENAWVFGLNRLMAGFAMPDADDAGRSVVPEDALFVGDVLPYGGVEGLDGETLGRAAHFIHTLFRALDLMARPGTVQTWAARFREIISEMLAKDANNDGEMAVLLNALDDMEKEAEQAGFERAISFSAVRLALTVKLDAHIAQGGFLSGGMTCCNLMPMRSIPFRLVCLMGMDAQSFPGTETAPGFDLIRQNPRPGDRLVRQEDCQIFLEALLGARLGLIITYTGMRIRDNVQVPVASPVDVLADTVENSLVFPAGFQWRFSHPLHPFSPDYFSRDRAPGYFSYSTTQCRICSHRNTRRSSDSDHLRASGFCVRKPDEDALAGDTARPPQTPETPSVMTTLALDDLIAFFRHPVQYYLTNTLGVIYPEPTPVPDEREPFRLSGLPLHHLGTRAVGNRENRDLYPQIKAQGLLPFGEKGRQVWGGINDLAVPVKELAHTASPDGEPHSVTLDMKLEQCRITGRVTDMYDKGRGRAVAGFGKLHPSRLLTQWIMHLAGSCVASPPGPTVIVGRDPKGKALAVTAQFAAIQEVPRARRLLGELAGHYIHGQRQIFPFFADISFALIQNLSLRDYDDAPASLAKALQQCNTLWYNRFQDTGASLNRYTALVFGRENPFATPQTLVDSGVLRASMAVYRPMLEHLT